MIRLAGKKSQKIHKKMKSKWDMTGHTGGEICHFKLINYRYLTINNVVGENTVLQLNILENGILTWVVQKSSLTRRSRVGDEFWTTYALSYLRTPVSKMFRWITYNSNQFRARYYLIKCLVHFGLFFSKDPPICPNSHVELSKIEIRSSLSRFEQDVNEISWILRIENIQRRAELKHLSYTERSVQEIGRIYLCWTAKRLDGCFWSKKKVCWIRKSISYPILLGGFSTTLV